VAATWITLAPLTVVPLAWMVLRRIQTTWLELGTALLPGLAGAIAMSGAVFMLRRWLAVEQWPVLASLALQVTIGGAVYAGVLLAFFRSRVLRYVNFLRGLRQEAEFFATTTI
jgi:hypothetical protein